MQTTEGIEIGQSAPDFKLKGPAGQFVTLSEYAGKRHVVLVFYPMAFSNICTHQLPEIEKFVAELDALDAVVMGISVDNHFANEAFARQLRVSFPLLSDFKREVSAAYGVLIADAGVAWRSLFVVSKQGKVIFKEVSPAPDDPSQVPAMAHVLAALRAQR